MKQRRSKQILSMLLVLCMVLAMVPATGQPVFADSEGDFSDMPNNWSTAALNKAVANNLLNGYTEKGQKLIKANNHLTRAEMAAVVNRAFASVKTADISKVSDISSSAWYANDMAKAVKMGTFALDNKMRPGDKITRQEAFTVLARAFKLVGTDSSHKALNAFSDKGEISSWALASLDGMAAAGYIQGSAGKLNPKANITRAEFAVVMDNLVKEYIDSGDTVTKVAADGNVIVRKAGTVLKDLAVKGDLIIADGVGEGDVTLDGVDVSGRLLVRGGGSKSIYIKGGSALGTIIIARVDGQVRVVNESGETIGQVVVDGSDDVILVGDFGTVRVLANNVKVDATEATIAKSVVEGRNSTIEGEVVEDDGGGDDGGGGGVVVPPVVTPVSTISISGDAVVGAILEATDLQPSGASVDYQWYRCGTNGEDDKGTLITGATGKTYTLVEDDKDKYIKVKVEGTGSYTGTVLSNATEKVKQLTSINVKTQPSDLVYIEGQSLNLAGLEITMNYSDSSTEDIALADFVEKNVTVNPANGAILEAGNNGNPVVVTAYGKTVSTNNLSVADKTVDELTIKTQPTKLSYVEGQALNLNGLVVTLKYNDGDEKDVAAADFAANSINASPSNGTALVIETHNSQPIVVSREGKEAKTENLNVVPKAVKSIAITQQPRLNYIEGQSLDLSDLKVSLTYNDTTTEDVVFAEFGSNLTLSIDGQSIDNQKILKKDDDNGRQITVTHVASGKNVDTETLNIVDRVVTGIEISKEPDKINYVEGEVLDLTDIKIKLIYNDESEEEVLFNEFESKGVKVDPVNNTVLKLVDDGIKLKITHTETGKHVESKPLIVTQAKYQISVKEPVGGNVTFTAENIDNNKAPIDSKVTITVTPEDGKQLLALSIKDSESNDLSKLVELAEIPDKIGQEFTFIMPGKDVTIDATIGESDKNIMYNAGIVGAGEIPLINGNLKDDASKEIDSLTWSYFTNTLTLNGFEGNYLGRANNNATDFDLELKGTNTITDTIRVNPGLKFQGQISIKGDGILKITNSFNSDEEFVRGISFQYSQSIIKLIDTAKVDISLEAKGSGGVAISNVMPFIGNGAIAYKGTAEWDSSHGTDGKPIGISYRVSSSTELKGKNIIVWDASNLVTDIWSVGFGGSSISSEDTIDLSSGEAIVYAKYNDIFYKITIIRDIPIENFSNTSKTDTTASFTWTQAKDATSIKIMQSPKDEDNWTDALIEGGTLEKTSFSATVTGLLPSQDYKFKLVVEGGDNRGDSNQVDLKTEAKNPDQIAVDAEVEKYEDTATIEKTVETGGEITNAIVKLLDGQTAGDGISLTYSVNPGTYLKVEDGEIKLKNQNFTENSVTETVTITFSKNNRSATKKVTVTIKSSDKKLIRIVDIEGKQKDYDMSIDDLLSGLSWDNENKVLTMDGYAGGAIHTNFEAGYELKNLVINGTNIITVNDESSTKPVIGFGTKAPLNITGSGTLTITVKSTNSSYTVGIYSGAYYEEGANPNFSGGYSGSTINIDNNTTISIDVESQKGTSYALYAQTLNFNNGTLNIASKSGNYHAYGIQVTDFNYTTGTVKVIDNKEISAGSLSDYSPSFSKETPYVKNSKARKITGLTWDSANDASEANKAVEYTIYLKSDLDNLQVKDIYSIRTLNVYSDAEFNQELTEKEGIIEFSENKATVYVKTTRGLVERYFKINLVKETP